MTNEDTSAPPPRAGRSVSNPRLQGIVLGILLVLLLTPLTVDAQDDPESRGSTTSRPSTPLRISGQILTPDGGVAAGTRITLHPLPAPVEMLHQRLTSAPRPTAITTTEPDGEGWFELLAPRVGFWSVRVEAPGFITLEHPLDPLLDHRSLAPQGLRRDVGLPFIPELDTDLGHPLALRARATRPEFWAVDTDVGWRPARREIRLTPESPLPDHVPRAQGEGLDVELLLSSGGILRWSGVESIDRTTTRTLEPLAASRADARGRQPLQVVDSDGEPLARGVLRLPGLDGWPIARTDSRGRVTIPAGIAELRLVDTEGLERRFALPTDDASDAASIVRLPSFRALEISLRSALDGRPIFGAVGTEGQRQITDEVGNAVLRFVEGDPAPVWAAAPGHLPWSGAPPPPGNAPWVLELEPAAALGGRVVDADDRPLAGVEIRILGGGGRWLRRAWSGAQGRFHLGLLPTDVALRLELRRPDLRRLVIEVPPLQPGERRFEPRIVLGSAALLLGRVVDGQGEPIAEVEVDVGPTRLDRQPKGQAGSGDGAEILSRDEGRFAARVTEPGFLDLDLRAEGFAPRRLPGILVDPESDRLDLGDLVLSPPARVWGRVVDSQDRPLAGVAVFRFDPRLGRADRLPYYLRFRRPETRTDPAGAFAIDTLPPGSTSTLAFQHPQHALAILRGVQAPGEVPLRITMQPARTLVGRVLDATGEPVVGADLRWWQQDRAGVAPAHGRRSSDAQGRFELPGVPVGTVVVEATSQRHRGISTEVEVDPDGELEELVLVLERGSGVQGRVLDPAGSPIRNAALSIAFQGSTEHSPAVWEGLPTGPPPGRRADSEADGSFRFQGLRAGRWRLRATRELVEKSLDLVVPPDAELEVDLVLGGEGEPIEGWVVVDTGASPRGVLLRLDPVAGGRRALATADDGGRVVFPDVVAGTYRVAVSASGERAGPPVALADDPGPWVVDGDPDTDEPIREVRVGLGARVHGRVLGLSADSWLQVQVEAAGERAIYTPRASRLDALGQYQLRGLGLGPWTLRAVVPGTGLQASRRLEIAPGETEIEVDLDFAAGLVLRGRVLRDEAEITQGTVTLRPADGSAIVQPLDHDGRFHFTGLVAGDHVLEVSLATGTLHRETIPLVTSTEWVVELR